jgi:hypothetical protein
MLLFLFIIIIAEIILICLLPGEQPIGGSFFIKPKPTQHRPPAPPKHK